MAEALGAIAFLIGAVGLLMGLVGGFSLSQATLGVGLIAGGIALLVVARITQAASHQRDLLKQLDELRKALQQRYP